MICKACGMRGYICKTKVVDLGIELLMCGKCSTCWTNDQGGAIKLFEGLSTFLKKHGLQYGCAELEGITIICQMCDQLGEIYKATVAKLGIELKFCDKCEACWAPNQIITMDSSETLATFLKMYGLEHSDVKKRHKIILCPRCDGQGEIHGARVIDLCLELMVCDECNACWTKEQKISNRTFKDLSAFLKEHGLIYEKTKIEDL